MSIRIDSCARINRFLNCAVYRGGMMHFGPSRGFTLIELAMVLVIIGLIVGGVLVGQNLIQAAFARNVIATTTELTIAANNFQSKYGCLPGDCSTATTAGISDTMGCSINGDGNGLIGIGMIDSMDYEAAEFFGQLGGTGTYPFTMKPTYPGFTVCTAFQSNEPGWISGPYYGSLNAGLVTLRDDLSVVFPIGWQGSNYYWIGGASPSCGYNYSFCPTLTTSVTAWIDSKVDDGLPTSGRVIAAGKWYTSLQALVPTFLPTGQPTAGPPGSSVCVNNAVTPNAYDLNSGGAVCDLLVSAGF